LAALVGWFGVALGEAPALRAEEWAGLGRLWEPVVVDRGLGCYRVALEAELAQFHEHRARDFAAARAVVTDALDLARTAGAAERVLDAFAYRLARIER